MEYQFSAEKEDGFLHVRVRGDNTVDTVRRWVRDGLVAMKEHRCGRALVEVFLDGESMTDQEVFTVATESARAALAQVSQLAYVDSNPVHLKEMINFVEYVAQLRGVNMRVFPDVRAAGAWLSQAADRPS